MYIHNKQRFAEPPAHLARKDLYTTISKNCGKMYAEGSPKWDPTNQGANSRSPPIWKTKKNKLDKRNKTISWRHFLWGGRPVFFSRRRIGKEEQEKRLAVIVVSVLDYQEELRRGANALASPLPKRFIDRAWTLFVFAGVHFCCTFLTGDETEHIEEVAIKRALDIYVYTYTCTLIHTYTHI